MPSTSTRAPHSTPDHPPSAGDGAAGSRLVARLAAPGGLTRALARVRAVVHAVIGVPDYDGYVRHLQARHPGCPIPSRREFERERLAARYEKPGSRCC